jgi:hypothetical protein
VYLLFTDEETELREGRELAQGHPALGGSEPSWCACKLKS